MRRRRHRLTGLGVLDQAMSSAANLLVVVAVARGSSPADLGAFAIAAATVVLVVTGARSLLLEALLVVDEPEREQSARNAVALSLLLGTTLAIAGCAAAVPTTGLARSVVLVTALSLPAHLFVDGLRYLWFARGKPGAAGRLDAIWLGTLAMSLVAAQLEVSPVSGLVLWGATAAVAGAIGAATAGTRPTFEGWRSWVAEARRLHLPFFGEFLVSTCILQVGTLGVGALAGLEPAGAVRAAGTVFGPVNVVFAGAYVVLVPQFQRDRGDVRLLRMGMVFASVIAVYSVTVAFLPDDLFERVLGDSWTLADGLTLWLGGAYAAGALALGPIVALRSAGEGVRSLRARLAGAPATVGLPLAGAVHSGALGFAKMTALAAAVQTALWWRTKRSPILEPPVQHEPDQPVQSERQFPSR